MILVRVMVDLKPIMEKEWMEYSSITPGHHSPLGKFTVANLSTCGVLDSWRQPENPQETHANKHTSNMKTLHV